MHESLSHFTKINPYEVKNFTPLPARFFKYKAFKKAFFLASIPFVFFGVLVAGYIFLVRNTADLGSTGSTSISQTPKILENQANESNSQGASVTPVAKSVPTDWLIKKSESCGLKMAIPPAQEPYIVENDPNTLPSSTDDEGKLWIYEDIDAELFTFKRLSRAIFKDPQNLGGGFVSSAVEVYCMPNTNAYTSETLENSLSESLADNLSVVKIKESIDDIVWGYPVKFIRFSGGSFGNERFVLFATKKYGYLIRSYGESTNKDITDVRDFIYNTLQFE